MNFKKILALILVIAVCCGITAGLTIAYMTDRDEEHNVFTVGNIDIDLREEVGVIGAGTVVKNDGEGANHGATYTNVMPGDKLQKKVTIANTGNNPAYVAVTVILNNVGRIHSAIDNHYEAKYGEDAPEVQEAYSNVFQGWGINYNPRPGAYGKNDARRVIDGTYGLPEHVLHVDYTQTTLAKDIYQISVGNWFKSDYEAADPNKYSGYRFSRDDGFYADDLGGFSRPMGEYELKYTYFLYLEPSEESVLFEGLNVPYEFDEEQIKMFENLKIDIYAAGIQASGFADAKTAFAALAGQTVNHVNVSTSKELNNAIENAKGTTTIMLEEGEYTTNVKVPAGSNITIGGEGEGKTVLSGQIATTSSTAGTITLKDLTIKVDDSIVDSTGISQTGKSAIALWGNQTVVCENVTFDMSLANSTAITSWWDTGVGTTIIVRNCTFNCNGQRPIRATGNVTVENCTFNDPYRYAVQLTAKASTATELDKAIINFKGNTIVNGANGKTFVYGIQLEGADYGCNNCVINGSGNTIENGGDDSHMYYCECGKVDHATITWNTEVAEVHEN